jgi:glutathione synthase/RimK-type ligase-like ATP-grasp enzyme
MATPIKIGLIVGREWSMPPALIEEISRRNAGVVAEYVQLGGTRMNEPVPYRVILDRISHEVPYYRVYLKHAALQGVKVINDPFMWASDDKFFDSTLACKVGVESPKTLVLPNKDYVPGIIHNESLRNLMYPMDWNWIVEYIGMPCVLKDAYGGGWRDVYVVHSMEELVWRYNQTGLLTMIAQEYIKWEDYARCMVLGQEIVHVMRYDPRTRVYHDQHGFSQALHDRLASDSLTLCRALGYDMNTVEFAIRGGVPYAIDFMNPAPDMDVNSLGRVNFDWCVKNLADMLIRYAKSDTTTADRYHWGKMAKDYRKK